MTWHATRWRPPQTGETPLRVRYRDGSVSKQALPAAKWNWRDRAFEYDITEWKEDN